MANKQTVVEWFISQLEEQGDCWENASIGRMQISIKVQDYLELKNQAKQMEKEQSLNFAKYCLDKAKDLDVRTAYLNVEQYYKRNL